MNDRFTDNHRDEAIAQKLNRVAEQTSVNSQFAAELEERLRNAHRPKGIWFATSFKQISPVLRWVALMILLGLVLSLSITTLIPARQPAANGTPTIVDIATPTKASANETVTPIPQSGGYDWRGAKLYLAAPLPESPAEANVYLLKPDQHATVEEARALAQQFGIQGELYISNGLYPATSGYFITDGKQSLSVNSSLYFTYTADMAKAYNNVAATTHPNAESIISDFLQSHGLDFPHKIGPTDLYGGSASVEPLSPDGFPMRYEYFSSRPMLVALDENGQVLRLEANLMSYEPASAQTYDIISAEEAFQKLMDDSMPAGKIESVHSSSASQIKEWRYTYPRNEMITIYGYASSIPALDPTEPSFTQIDGYAATGNTNGFDTLQSNTFIEANGQFITENGIEKFRVGSWKPSEFPQDGLVGTLRRENGQVLFLTTETEPGELILNPDVPADLPLPFENAFVLGVRKGNTYEWTLIDDRMAAGNRGGGGGGGGLGFYKLNLSGTPVPFPSPTSIPTLGDGNYTVKEGDTLSMIAQDHDITVDELMKANGLNDPMIFIGQKLIIPNPNNNPNQPPIGQRYEGQRGILTVNIFNRPDGSQRGEYYLAINNHDELYPYVILEGNGLEQLQAYHNRPIAIWGNVVRYNEQNDMPIVQVERFEIPFPDLQFQIIKGTQKSIDIEGKTAILFTADNGKEYIQMQNNGDVDFNIPDYLGQEVIFEALIIPDETYDDYPTLRVYSSAPAISPKNGQPVELTITSDQPYVGDESVISNQVYTPPSATVEKVDLIYYVTNQHWQVEHLDGGPQYIQPAWRFSGHYDNGDEFEILVQALKQEYLLPELAPYIQGG